MSGPLRGGANGRMNALVTAATADVASHGIVNLLVAGRWGLCQQCRGLHDLAGLAIAALRYGKIAPSYLHWMLTLRIEAFDRSHGLAGNVRHDDGAGADGLAVDMDCAGPAEGSATTEFRAG